MTTSWPWPRAIISGSTACTELAAPITLTSITEASFAASKSAAGFVRPMPALAISTSMRPNADSKRSAASRIDCWSETSAASDSTSALFLFAPDEISEASSCSSSRRRATNPSFAPRRASSRARPRPMPDDAPVISTTLFDQSMPDTSRDVPIRIIA